MTKLLDKDYVVSLETSGALDVSEVDWRVVKVMDLKTPSSGELARNCYQNIEYLTKKIRLNSLSEMMMTMTGRKPF
jgi:hypothetical protein